MSTQHEAVGRSHAVIHPIDEALRGLLAVCRRSPLKRAILSMLLEGKSRKQIACELRRSAHTIDGPFKALHRAAGVGDRTELALLASRLGALMDAAEAASTDEYADMPPLPPPVSGVCNQAALIVP
jgi:DNA-binding CsgD family transcriptional regulator